MIAVTFALPTESSDFVRVLEGRRRRKKGGVAVDTGRLHGREIAVMHTGVGERATRARLHDFFGEQKPSLVVSAGFCGALQERLTVGDLLLATNRTTPELLASAERSTSATIGTLTTAHSVIDSAASRERIALESGADAVDMETEFIVDVCAKLEIPTIALRVVTDTPRAPFPAPPQLLFNLERQRTEFLPLFFHLLAHPATIPRLLAFAQTISRCRRRLTSALDLLLRDAVDERREVYR